MHDARLVRMRASISWAILLLLVPLGTGCAESLGRRTTTGVLGAAQTHLQQPPNERGERSDAATLAAKRVTSGALYELTNEERRALFAQMGHDIARGVTTGIHGELVTAVGPNGEGPLGDAISGAVLRATDAAIFPECAGPNRSACVRSQVRAVVDAAVGGMVQSLRQKLGLGALVIAFAAGALFALGALGTWTSLRSRAPRAPVAPRRSATT